MVNAGIAAAVALMLLLVGCDHGHPTTHRPDPQDPVGFVWELPEGFPTPLVPADNPITWEKVELGRQLFHDTRLSGDGTVSCATCHRPELAYTDGRSRAVGVQGNIHPRSAMSLTNVAYNSTLGWDDPSLTRLEDQIAVPLFNTQPPEMGLAGREDEVLNRLRSDRRYRRLFKRAFPEEEQPVTLQNMIYALATFERTLLSGDSSYDLWAYGGEVDALNSEERAGARLFFSKRLSCFRCHAGFNFSGPVFYEDSKLPEPLFHNTALYDEDGRGAYPAPNTGVHRITGRMEDMGKFRAPTLRNIALTAPYMHDGSIATLEAVLDHYAAGGRAQSSPPKAPETSRESGPDPLMTGFELTPEERKQLIAFLNALTDESFIAQAVKQSVR